MSKIRAIAYYLPQFHPIPENDEWWGKGFTEWTNVAKAKPLFRGHEQPKLPADLGFYDLRVPEVREQQAQMAKDAGIEGFCYWHYWFGNGKKLLDRPFKEVLESGKPDFPFCLGWANESWSGIWHGAKDKILIKQEYPGVHDYEAHFYDLLPAFNDKRYIRVDNKPLFLIYQPLNLPDINEFVEVFSRLAKQNGLNGIHFVASNIGLKWDPRNAGFNALIYASQENIMNHYAPLRVKIRKKLKQFDMLTKFINLIDSKPLHVYTFEKAMQYFTVNKSFDFEFYHTIFSGWDNSPRSGKNGFILTNFNPVVFRKHVNDVISKTIKTKNKIVFIKSWNEWAEGNYLEPDLKYGKSLLNVLKQEIEIGNSVIG
ncbi:MAG: glycoside hydrolase family 99-like domain-containing protein [Paludibacter sp.]|nr:glycoside hydrolase family 99-like domain-containing protein [Paludibacter sp.]